MAPIKGNKLKRSKKGRGDTVYRYSTQRKYDEKKQQASEYCNKSFASKAVDCLNEFKRKYKGPISRYGFREKSQDNEIPTFEYSVKPTSKWKGTTTIAEKDHCTDNTTEVLKPMNDELKDIIKVYTDNSYFILNRQCITDININNFKGNVIKIVNKKDYSVEHNKRIEKIVMDMENNEKFIINFENDDNEYNNIDYIFLIYWSTLAKSRQTSSIDGGKRRKSHRTRRKSHRTRRKSSKKRRRTRRR